MATNMFQLTAPLAWQEITAVATGHVALVMGWEDTPNGRRPGSTPELDPDTQAPFQNADVLLPLGREGQPVLVTVRFAAHEVVELPAYQPVELVGLRATVRGSRQGKGVDVSFTADAIRPAGKTATPRSVKNDGEAA